MQNSQKMVSGPMGVQIRFNFLNIFFRFRFKFLVFNSVRLFDEQSLPIFYTVHNSTPELFFDIFYILWIITY